MAGAAPNRGVDATAWRVFWCDESRPLQCGPGGTGLALLSPGIIEGYETGQVPLSDGSELSTVIYRAQPSLVMFASCKGIVPESRTDVTLWHATMERQSGH